MKPYKIDILKDKLKPYLEKLNNLPSEREFRNDKRFDIIHLIDKNGGYKKTAEILNIKNKRLIKTLDGDRVLSSYELFFDNFLYLNNIKHVVGEKIIDGSNYKYDFKISNLNNGECFVEIWGMNTETYLAKRKKKEKLYKKNNLILISIEKEIFQNKTEDIIEKLENIMCEYKIKLDHNSDYSNIFNGKFYNKEIVLEELNIIIDEIGRFPSHKDLKELDMGYLDKHICKHGGYRKLRTELDQEQLLIDWDNIENIKKEILPLCKKYGRLPTEKELLGTNKQHILSCYAKYGIQHISNFLGYKTFKEINNIKPGGYWNIEDNFKQELKNFIKKLGHIPKNKDFIKNGRKDLLNASNRHYDGLKNINKYIV